MLLRSLRRMMSSVPSASRMMHAPAYALTYDEPGEPLDVLKLTQQDAPQLQPEQIRVQMLKAAINPSDINTVQGKYPIRPSLPGGVPGHEGVGTVTEVGSQVQGLKVGDLVVPLESGQGTWRQQGCFASNAWHPVPKGLEVDQAAQLCINPPTALAFLEHFVDLKPGEVVVQNGGTSAVAQLVTQLGRARGLKIVSVVRPRPDMDDTVKRLKELGADLVTTDEKLKDDLNAANLGPPPRLGLNCVGGASALAVCKVLAEGGTLVTYGGMSMQPVPLPTTLLIFKDLTFKGFWLSGRFAKEQGPAKRREVLDYLAQLFIDSKLHTKTVTFPLSKWEDAFRAASEGQKNGKVLLDLTQAPQTN